MAKKVFIDPITIINNYDGTSGYRLVEVIDEANAFPIAEPYFWADCDPQLDGHQSEYYYDPIDSTIKLIPIEPEKNIDALLDELLLTEGTN